MDDIKKKRYIRIVSLIALTIFVVTAIALTIYFVQKNDEKNKIEYISGDIGKDIEVTDLIFKVKDFKSTSEGQADGYAKVTISIEIKAKETLDLKLEDFKLGDYAISSQSGFTSHIEKDNNSSFELNYVVKLDQKLLYIIYHNIKIALGEAYA